MLTYIYGLIDPITQECRYVGKSNNPSYRLRKHIERSKKLKNHKDCWIISLKDKGFDPKMIILEESNSVDWIFDEQWWISYLKFLGCRLTNSTSGGDGCFRFSEATRKRMSISAKESHKIKPRLGHPLTEEAKRKISKANKGKKRSDEFKENLRSRVCSETTREKLSLAAKGRKLSDEARHNISEAKKGDKNPNFGKKYSDEERRLKSIAMSGGNNPMFGKTHTESARRKISESRSGDKHPNFGKKHSEETKAKMALARKLHWEKRKSASKE